MSGDAGPHRRVLLIEDDLPIAELIADELRYNGFIVDAVGNGADALESLSVYRPDAIVLDLMMQVVNGWDFAERYLATTHGRVIPTVVVSAAGAVPKSMEALGVRRFFAKPFDVAELVRAVSEVANTNQ